MKVIFGLKRQDVLRLFDTEADVPQYFAYVEWFTSFEKSPRANHLLYQIKRSIQNGDRLASVIGLPNIRRSIHLFPVFGPVVPSHWTSDNVLDECSTFYVNCFTDRQGYHTIM